jgi:hypothetical protein
LYEPAAEIGIAWNDPALAIPWPVEGPLLSDRDRGHPPLVRQTERLPIYTPKSLNRPRVASDPDNGIADGK